MINKSICLSLAGNTAYNPSISVSTARDSVAYAVVSALAQVASYSGDNLARMSKKGDVVAACLTHLADYLKSSLQCNEGDLNNLVFCNIKFLKFVQ